MKTPTKQKVSFDVWIERGIDGLWTVHHRELGKLGMISYKTKTEAMREALQVVSSDV